ncbi:hypothetical protein [Actinomadura hibisca]|uniref:hypothetical protein n=1 Tax=Actinomadura hibisca TaxID=68565 RepID=UPI0012FAFC48|nr:hypothetical protein [Actinomadura hibisca]
MTAEKIPTSPLFRAASCLLATTLLGSTLTACGQEKASSGALNPNGTFDSASPAPSGSAPPTGTAHPSSLPTPQVNQDVLSRYREFQKVYKQVYERNDATDLATVAVDPVLTNVTRDVEKVKAANQVWRFTLVTNPKVYARAKDGLTVYVVDCLRTLGSYRFSTKTGKRTGGGPGGAFVYRTAVRYDSGTWKVSDSIRDEKC